MTKKDFEIIAETIRDGREYFGSNTGHAQFASDFAQRLTETNPRFDRARFIMACMPSAWVGSSKANPWDRIASGDRY